MRDLIRQLSKFYLSGSGSFNRGLTRVNALEKILAQEKRVCNLEYSGRSVLVYKRPA